MGGRAIGAPRFVGRALSISAGLAVVLGTSALGAPAQDIVLTERGSTVTGHIEIEGVGGPSERLEVLIQKANGSGDNHIIAESGGYFFARGFYPGNYVFTVRPPARMNLSEGSSELTINGGSSGSNYVVTIQLRRNVPSTIGIGAGRMIAAQESDRSVPKEARKAYKVGTDAARKQNVEGAIAAYRQAIDIAPTYLFALNDLGVELTRAGRYADAVEILQRAVAVAATSFPPHLNLAIALVGSGKIDEASNEVEKALAIDAAAADALYLSGLIAKRRGFPIDAIEAFRKAYDNGGADVIYAQYELGQLYDTGGQPVAAVQAFRLFLQFIQQGPQAEHARQRLKELTHG